MIAPRWDEEDNVQDVVAHGHDRPFGSVLPEEQVKPLS
jgi:hypothetical protein